ncbi:MULTISPECIES: hypothetical protein [unclassified Pseudovibrio]|uniref:hypothetical protein n=1 Tax=unclassified Pseudovibrio TaxID=2627060 RepID=UPI0007AE6F68|nr:MULTISPECIES: hypothetical protein [unclassified Pseudovibrio]KZK94423.1 hypothetical protein PsW74_04668 [Pseudovibrio sp. W74]KZL04463.1 hypothetical protein PsAD14_05528 [Pseudovibrio sp. Ad14]
MSTIELSSFVAAAQFDNGLDKLHTTQETVTQRTSHTSVGGKVLSWAKLHITGDGQKSADQTRFQEALKTEFGKDVGEAAYKAFAPGDGKAHSLTKAQVLDTVELALTTQENKAEELNVTTQAAILTSITNTHGAEVAANVTKLLEGSSEFANVGTDPEQIKAIVSQIAEDVAKNLEVIDASITQHIEKLGDREHLAAAASEAGIQIDWDNVSPEQITKLQENVQGKLENQSRPDKSNSSIRSSLKDEHIQQAVNNQLRAIEALQSASAGGTLLVSVFSELGLPAEKVSAAAFGEIATVLNGVFNTVSGPEGTNDITDQIDDILQKSIINSAVQDVLKSTLREAAQTDEFSSQIAPFIPEGTPKEIKAAQKWLPDLAAKEIVRSIKDDNDFQEQGGIVNAAKAELGKQIETAQSTNEIIKGFVEHLTADEINAELLTEFIAKHSNNADGLGGDDNKFAAERHFTKIFKEHPEIQQQLNDAFHSEKLKENSQIVSEAIELITKKVEDQLVNRLQQAGKHPTEAYATASVISSTLKGPFVQLFAPLLDSLDSPDENTVSEGEFLEQKQAVTDAFFFPSDPSEDAAEIANGLVKSFHNLFEKHNLQLDF